MFTLSEKSKEKLSGVSPELVKVVERAIQISPIDFFVTEGLRTVERQKMLVASGKSQTMKSKHIIGRAVDLAAMPHGTIDWSWKYYEQLAEVMKKAAKELGIAIEWGGDWVKFRDGVHFQLKDR